MHFTGTKSYYLYYVVVKAQQLFGLNVKVNCFCYRYPSSCLSEKSINSSMQHLQNIISFNFLYLQKMICPKIIDFKTHNQIKTRS